MPGAKPLRGITVIVTRPLNQATAITRLLTEQGAEVIHLPLIEIQPVNPTDDVLAALQYSAPFELIIFTSQNAVHYGLPLVRDTWIGADTQLAAIGPATRTALYEAGIESCLTGASPYDSESLLKTDALKFLQSSSVLLVKGEGGRTELLETIKKRGGFVHELHCYRRCVPALANEILEQIRKSDIIMFTSRESACNLLSLLSKNLLNDVLTLTPVVGHTRIAETIRQLGFKKHPIIASNPSDTAMLNALIHYAGNGDLE